MVALMLNISIGTAIAVPIWLVFEQLIMRLLPRLERFVPSDIIGPDGWLADTTRQAGIFDLPMKRHRG